MCAGNTSSRQLSKRYTVAQHCREKRVVVPRKKRRLSIKYACAYFHMSSAAKIGARYDGLTLYARDASRDENASGNFNREVFQPVGRVRGIKKDETKTAREIKNIRGSQVEKFVVRVLSRNIQVPCTYIKVRARVSSCVRDDVNTRSRRHDGPTYTTGPEKPAAVPSVRL